MSTENTSDLIQHETTPPESPVDTPSAEQIIQETLKDNKVFKQYYSFAEAAVGIEQHVLAGYTLETDSVSEYPVAMMNNHLVWFKPRDASVAPLELKPSTKDLEDALAETQQEVLRLNAVLEKVQKEANDVSSAVKSAKRGPKVKVE